MSRYQHLHIYKETYQLMRLLFSVVPKFDRNYRSVIGYRILDNVTDMITYITRINSLEKEKRNSCFDKLSDKAHILGVHLQIANELHLFGKESVYIQALGFLSKIKKMIKNWERS